jgi:hypothetical protein
MSRFNDTGPRAAISFVRSFLLASAILLCSVAAAPVQNTGSQNERSRLVQYPIVLTRTSDRAVVQSTSPLDLRHVALHAGSIANSSEDQQPPTRPGIDMNQNLTEKNHQPHCGCPGNPNTSTVQAVYPASAPLSSPVAAYVPSSTAPTQLSTASSSVAPLHVYPASTEMPEATPEVSVEPEATPESSMEPEVTPESSMEPEVTPESSMEPEVTPESSLEPEMTPESSQEAKATELPQMPSRQPVTAPVSFLRGESPASLEVNLPPHWNGSFAVSSNSR